MPPTSDRPLQKVTMNFFRDDVATLVGIYGTGWTTEVRQIIADFVREHRRMSQTIPLRGGEASDQ